MTREEVYDKCTERVGNLNFPSFRKTKDGVLEKIKDENIMRETRFLLPQEAIDAIIDCAVEEAIRAVKEGKE